MRLQLALNVSDIDAAVEFYSRLFSTEPAKRKPGYANFAITNPPLKLVLFEGEGEGGSINHLGVETDTVLEVSEAEARLLADGLETTGIEETICCYAEKTETWVTGPDGERWEWYVKSGDAEQMENVVLASSRDSALGCCNTDNPGESGIADASPTGINPKENNQGCCG